MGAKPSELFISTSPSSISTFYGSVQRKSARATRMSATPRHSNDDNFTSSKRRRIERACDACRRRKTKCDGPKMPKNICTNCTQGRKHCTYVEESKPRGPPKAYITSLEDKVEEMEAMLKMLHPETDLDAELGPPILRGSWRSDFRQPSNQSGTSKPNKSPSNHSSKIAYSMLVTETESIRSPLLSANLYSYPVDRRRSPLSMSPSTDLSTSSHEKQSYPVSDGASDICSDSEYSCDESHLPTGVRHLAIHSMSNKAHNQSMDTNTTFLGKSSGMQYVRLAMKMKAGFIEQLQPRNPSIVLPSGQDSSESHKESHTYPRRREEFWTTPPWQLRWESGGDNLSHLLPDLKAGLPADDLARALIDIFFLHTNSQFPLLHRPTFEGQWRSGLQTRDVWFACLCFSIFAVASRWSDDPRVLSEPHVSGSDGGNHSNWRNAGSKYCDLALLVLQVPCGIVTGATLPQIQAYAALSIYLRGTSDGPLAWLCIGMGLRKAQDLGVHRKWMYGNELTVEEEQWKRAFWILIVLDRINSAILGRTCCTDEAGYDLDLPVEVDDEYWENKCPKLAFKQPSEKPSLVAAFNSLIKLTRVVSIALRTIYAVDKTKLRIGVSKGSNWQTEIIMQLNTTMTDWVDSLPQHLKWAPTMRDQVFADQAATLHTIYYLNQILIYRQFIPTATVSRKSTHLKEKIPFPASTICTHAAKECAKILDTQIRRGVPNIPLLISVANICGAILASNIWYLKLKNREQQIVELDNVKPQFLATIESHKNDISTFMKALEHVKSRWELASVVLQRLKESLPNPVDDLQGLVQMEESDATPVELCQFLDLQNTHIGAPSVLADEPTADIPSSWPLGGFAQPPHTQYPPSQLPYSSQLHPSFSSPYVPTLTSQRYSSSLPPFWSPQHERLPRDLSRMRVFNSTDDLAAPMTPSAIGTHLPSISLRATARSIRDFHDMKLPDAPGNWLQVPTFNQFVDQRDSAGHFPYTH